MGRLFLTRRRDSSGRVVVDLTERRAIDAMAPRRMSLVVNDGRTRIDTQPRESLKRTSSLRDYCRRSDT